MTLFRITLVLYYPSIELLCAMRHPRPCDGYSIQNRVIFGTPLFSDEWLNLNSRAILVPLTLFDEILLLRAGPSCVKCLFIIADETHG